MAPRGRGRRKVNGANPVLDLFRKMRDATRLAGLVAFLRLLLLLALVNPTAATDRTLCFQLPGELRPRPGARRAAYELNRRSMRHQGAVGHPGGVHAPREGRRRRRRRRHRAALRPRAGSLPLRPTPRRPERALRLRTHRRRARVDVNDGDGRVRVAGLRADLRVGTPGWDEEGGRLGDDEGVPQVRASVRHSGLQTPNVLRRPKPKLPGPAVLRGRRRVRRGFRGVAETRARAAYAYALGGWTGGWSGISAAATKTAAAAPPRRCIHRRRRRRRDRRVHRRRRTAAATTTAAATPPPPRPPPHPPPPWRRPRR